MTWSEFLTTVTNMLGVDADRIGAETFTPAWIRQAVIHLQTKLDCYRMGHETLIHPKDLVTEGMASRGVKPPQSVVRDVYLCQTVTDEEGKKQCDRYPVDIWPWDSRYALVEGRVALNGGRGLWCPDPQGYTFWVYPEMADDWVISLHWDGLKLDFQPDEETPFDEAMAGAVVHFVKAQLAREVEKDIGLHDSYMKSFQIAQAQLFTRAREITNGRL